MKKLILIVEDELLIAHDMKQILEEEGYNVEIGINTVDKAIQIIEEINPHLVLIDINLNNEKCGVDIGKYLLKKDKIPYIYVTSFSDKVTIDEVNNTRPHGFIVKPFKPIDISTTISIVLNNYNHRLIDPQRNDSPIKDDVPFRIRKTIDYINENIDSRIELNKVAALTKWKLPHFIRIFTRYIGITPYQYILRRKVEKAMVLLEETDMSSNEIAFELGFESYSNFNAAFKKITQTTSDAYRKKKQAEK